MSTNIRPLRHVDPYIDATRGYVTHVGDELQARGTELSDVWLDPAGPRDATFVLADGRALVWNESEGFLLGRFVAGSPGVRTVLADPVRLGGGVLADPARLAHLIESGPVGSPPSVRSFALTHDGFDDALGRHELE